MSYGPFEVPGSGNLRFSLQVVENLDFGGGDLIYSNRDDVEPGFIMLNVYRSSAGHFFEITQPSSSDVNGCLFACFVKCEDC